MQEEVVRITRLAPELRLVQDAVGTASVTADATVPATATTPRISFEDDSVPLPGPPCPLDAPPPSRHTESCV